jgi:hypothetical protein
MAARTWLPGKDCWDKIAGQDDKERIARKRLAVQGSQHGTARTEQPEQDRQIRKGRTRQVEQVRQKDRQN